MRANEVHETVLPDTAVLLVDVTDISFPCTMLNSAKSKIPRGILLNASEAGIEGKMLFLTVKRCFLPMDATRAFLAEAAAHAMGPEKRMLRKATEFSMKWLMNRCPLLTVFESYDQVAVDCEYALRKEVEACGGAQPRACGDTEETHKTHKGGTGEEDDGQGEESGLHREGEPARGRKEGERGATRCEGGGDDEDRSNRRRNSTRSLNAAIGSLIITYAITLRQTPTSRTSRSPASAACSTARVSPRKKCTPNGSACST